MEHLRLICVGFIAYRQDETTPVWLSRRVLLWLCLYLILHQLSFYPSVCSGLLFPWGLSCQDFGCGEHFCQVLRPQAPPAFAPGCTVPSSAHPAWSNPHPHPLSHGWVLQAPGGVPAEPGVLGGKGAALSWPGGLSPAEWPDVFYRGAGSFQTASHQLLPFFSFFFLPAPKRRVQQVLQVTDESSGARGSMDASAWEKCSEGGSKTKSRRWGKAEGRRRETVQFSVLDAGRWLSCWFESVLMSWHMATSFYWGG